MQTLVLGNIKKVWDASPEGFVPLTQDLVAEDGYNPDHMLEI